MNQEKITDSFAYLKSVCDIFQQDRADFQGIVLTATTIEMLLSVMTPKARQRLWMYLSKVRKEMANIAFEDEEDYTTFIAEKDIKL